MGMGGCHYVMDINNKCVTITLVCVPDTNKKNNILKSLGKSEHGVQIKNSIVLMSNFPCLIMILWTCRIMSLFLQNNVLKYLLVKCQNVCLQKKQKGCVCVCV